MDSQKSEYEKSMVLPFYSWINFSNMELGVTEEKMSF
jgi:hypothetical protein